MKAIILAAGKGSRMEPLTCTKPKPMVLVANKPFLTFVLEEIVNLVSEAIIVIHPEDKQTPRFGTNYKSIALSYVIQKEQLGTGHALLCAKDFVSDKFLLLNGDALVPRKDIDSLVSKDVGMLAWEVQDLSAYGAIINTGDYLQEIKEKSIIGPGLANAGVYLLQKEILSCLSPVSPRGEYELTDMLNLYAKKKSLNVLIAKEKHYSITHPWDLLEVNRFLLTKISTHIEGTLKRPVAIEGPVIINVGTEVDAFATIKGPCMIGENCKLGPNTYIRPYTSIGNNCRINCEIKNSVLYDSVNSVHSSSHILDSVIGENVNIGAGTITANLRHDGANICSEVNGKLVDTGLHKLGAIIGNNVHTGIGTAIRPGRKLWPNTTTLEHEVVTKDKH